MNSTNIMIGILTGSIGIAYFVYGKKQMKVLPIISGLGLMGLPYVIGKIWLLLLVSLILIILPFVIKD